MSGRSRILSFGLAAVLVAVGGAGAVAFSGTLGQMIALVLIGLGFVLATGLVFFEVGLSEDRERDRDRERARDRDRDRERARARAREQPSAGGPRGPGAGTPRRWPGASRPRLDRMRGSRRRLS